jgi:hypothetical protein
MDKKGQKVYLGGRIMDSSTGKGGKVKGVRIGIRKCNTREKKQYRNNKKLSLFGKSSEVIPLVSNPGIGVQMGDLTWSYLVTGCELYLVPSVHRVSCNWELR